MKIKKIELHNYKQFKDVTLDLTYPKGHEKEGQPLDKICIIGQSGTGKTNLLEVIKNRIDDTEVKIVFYKEENLYGSKKVYFLGSDKHFEKKEKQNEIFEQNKLLINQLEHMRKVMSLDDVNHKLLISDTISRIKHYLYYDSEAIEKYLSSNKRAESHSYININFEIWDKLENKLDNYHENRLKYIEELSNKLLNFENYNKEDFRQELQEWETQNDNILEQTTIKLNKMLRKFNLELIELNSYQRGYDDLEFKDLSNNNIIEYKHLSTGTKNLIATFIPLKIHNPKDSIILIDEPENSFYPDIQRKLTELYMEVGENNQVIFATHSPLIASSFEPWEVVELKFDKDNQIYREEYYDKEKGNHIDNYTLDPRMLTWTGILTDIFDLKEDSNFTYREKKLMEYIRLEQELKTIEDKALKKEKFEELMRLSNKLGLSGNEKD